MSDKELIESKIINGEELSEEEIQYITWEWKEIDSFENGEHHRWYAPTTIIFEVKGAYYAIEYGSPLTELQECIYWPQKAVKVEQKPVTVYKWVVVD